MNLSKPLRVVHVDDDPGALRKLHSLLSKEENIHYLGGYTSAEEAFGYLQKEKADLIFMDVEMPGNNGFWLAQQLRNQQPDIAFVTSYAGYAAQAFEACALDYLLKPMDEDKLHVLLERVRHKRMAGENGMEAQIEAIYNYLDPRMRPARIFINTVGKINVLSLDQILYFCSTNNYTMVVMNSGDRHVSSKTIKTYEEALKNHPDFLRVSRAYIINKNYVSSIERELKTRRITLLMSNGDLVETSFKTKEEIIGLLSI